MRSKLIAKRKLKPKLNRIKRLVRLLPMSGLKNSKLPKDFDDDALHGLTLPKSSASPEVAYPGDLQDISRGP